MMRLILLLGFTMFSCSYGDDAKTQPTECQLQRQQMYQCLTKLNVEKDKKQMDLITQALTAEDQTFQMFWLSQWKNTVDALEKCRKLDTTFNECAPTPRTVPDLTNHTSYLLDKIECIHNSSESVNVLELKESFARQIELQCFGTSAPPSERQCIPNEKVKKCLLKEMSLSNKIQSTINVEPIIANITSILISATNETDTNSTLEAVVVKEEGVERFYKMFEPSKDKLQNWDCYECLYLASEECRPSKKQRACIVTQKKPIINVYKRNLKTCMASKGYSQFSFDIDEFELMFQMKDQWKSDFCEGISDDLYIR